MRFYVKIQNFIQKISSKIIQTKKKLFPKNLKIFPLCSLKLHSFIRRKTKPRSSISNSGLGLLDYQKTIFRALG